MAQFVTIPITIDIESLQDDAYAYIASKVPGYELNPAHPETWIIEAVARMSSELAFMASAMPETALRTLGETVYNIPRSQGAPAVAATTWIANNTNGVIVPQDTQISIDGIGFRTDSEVLIPPGQNATAAGGVLVTAIDIGIAGNNLINDVRPIDALSWIESISLFGVTSGGEDSLSDEEYRDYLVRTLQLQAPRVITVRDFELFVQDIPGVARVTVIDNTERSVTIAAIDSNGVAVNAAIQAEIVEKLEQAREANWIITIIQPTYTNVNVAYNVVGYNGFEAAALKGLINTAISDYLSPSRWGNPPYSELNTWVNEPKVRYLQLARIIEEVGGVNYINSLTINTVAGDFTMPGTIPLPNVGTLTATVNGV
jgi:hypothetical protein